MGREVVAAGEAQHCLQLHPEATLLGVTTDHLRQAGGRPLSGVSVLCGCGWVFVCLFVCVHVVCVCLFVYMWCKCGSMHAHVCDELVSL